MNIEYVRDTIAGALIGAILAVVLFLLSVVNAAFHLIAGLFSSGASFEAMSGQTFTVLILSLMIIGAAVGFCLGFYSLMDSTIEKKVKKWMEKNNRRSETGSTSRMAKTSDK